MYTQAKINMYCIYLIKRPGVYFLAASVERAFKQDGRLFETSVYCFVYTSNSCSSAVIMLFLAAATALSVNPKS